MKMIVVSEKTMSKEKTLKNAQKNELAIKIHSQRHFVGNI
jgi:hypothetical protein